jgi:hypothetical protein
MLSWTLRRMSMLERISWAKQNHDSIVMAVGGSGGPFVLAACLDCARAPQQRQYPETAVSPARQLQRIMLGAPALRRGD